MLMDGQPPVADGGAPAAPREEDDLAWLRVLIDREVPELVTIAEKVSWLRETLHPPGRPCSFEDIEARIRAGVTATGRPVDPAVRPMYKASARQIGNVASGATTNPGFEMLATLAAFFHVDPKFFFSRHISARELFAPALVLLGSPRPRGTAGRRARTARLIATRAGDLSVGDQQMLLGLIERLAEQRRAPGEET